MEGSKASSWTYAGEEDACFLGRGFLPFRSGCADVTYMHTYRERGREIGSWESHVDSPALPHGTFPAPTRHCHLLPLPSLRQPHSSQLSSYLPENSPLPMQ